MRKVLGLAVKIVREAFWVAVAVAIVAGGILGFRYLGENRDVVEAEPAPRPIALVETVALEQLDGTLPIRGEGFVQPLRQLSLSSQVSGRVTYVHPSIFERGQFDAGTVLVRLDDRAAAASLEQADANIAATQARIEQNAQDVDRVQQLVESGVASRTQLNDLLSARDELAANLSGFMAARRSAEIAQQDRTIIAPFDGAVLSENVEVGDVVSPGQELAAIFTQSAFEVTVPVRQADAALIPGLFEGAAPLATVDVPFADYTFRWQGRVTRIQPELDAVTRTLLVAVRLEQLADVEGASVSGRTIASGAPPALINAYAQVTIDGMAAEGAFRIPSTAMRPGGEVWVYEDGTLTMAEAEAIHVDGEDTYIASDALSPGARVVTSELSAPVAGMALRDARVSQQAALTE
ncbi:MAG: efflux RND transporter periplasmic adaptor subunit [Pseudomonadota bacterium]